MKDPCCYIMASQRNGTLYVGVTADLMRRVDQHRHSAIPGFTRDKSVKRLVWFEQNGTMAVAIAREKQLKAWRRTWKLALIEKDNPLWRDLAEDWGFDRIE